MTLRRGEPALQRVDRHFTVARAATGRELGPTPSDRRRLGRPGRRRDGRDRADGGRHVHGVGGHDHRPRVRVEERRRRSASARSAGRGSTTTRPRRTASSSSIYVDPDEREPRVDLVQRLQRQHPGHAGPRLRGDVTTRAPARRPGRTGPTTGATCRSPTSPSTTVTGDLYASSDFGVSMPRRPARRAGCAPRTGMPNVEVAGLTMVSGERVLYAASHGLGAWRLRLG